MRFFLLNPESLMQNPPDPGIENPKQLSPKLLSVSITCSRTVPCKKNLTVFSWPDIWTYLIIHSHW